MCYFYFILFIARSGKWIFVVYSVIFTNFIHILSRGRERGTALLIVAFGMCAANTMSSICDFFVPIGMSEWTDGARSNRLGVFVWAFCRKQKVFTHSMKKGKTTISNDGTHRIWLTIHSIERTFVFLHSYTYVHTFEHIFIVYSFDFVCVWVCAIY